MNSIDPDIEVLAATAWTQGPASLPARIVLCRMVEEHPRGAVYKFITWMEVDHGDRGFGFCNGDYTFDRTEAWPSFSERAQRHLNMEWNDAEQYITTDCSALRVQQERS